MGSNRTFQTNSQLGFGVEFQGQSAEDDLYKLQENHGDKEPGKQAILKQMKEEEIFRLKNILNENIFVPQSCGT